MLEESGYYPSPPPPVVDFSNPRRPVVDLATSREHEINHRGPRRPEIVDSTSVLSVSKARNQPQGAAEARFR